MMANVTQLVKERLAQLEQQYPHTFGMLNLGWWGKRKFCKNIGEYKAPVFDICESMLEDRASFTKPVLNSREALDNCKGMYRYGAPDVISAGGAEWYVDGGPDIGYVLRYGSLTVDLRPSNARVDFKLTKLEGELLHKVAYGHLNWYLGVLNRLRMEIDDFEVTSQDESQRARWTKVLRGEDGTT